MKPVKITKTNISKKNWPKLIKITV